MVRNLLEQQNGNVIYKATGIPFEGKSMRDLNVGDMIQRSTGKQFTVLEKYDTVEGFTVVRTVEGG